MSTIVENQYEDQFMAFIQTADMLEMFKRNYKSGILISSIPFIMNKNKYNIGLILITGIDNDIGNIITFGLGLINQKTAYSVNWILVKFMTAVHTLNKLIKTVVCDLDKTIMKSAKKVFEK